MKTPGCWSQRDRRSRKPPAFLLLVAALLAAGCATAPRTIDRRDRFPLDPREEQTGPFADEIVRGCAALADGNARDAEAAFAAARSGGAGRLAAEIGWIEAVVLQGRTKDALPVCEKLLGSGDPTLPLLVACGEARAAAGDAVGGHSLYRRAVARIQGAPA